MSKITKKILKSILLSSVMSLMHMEAKAQDPFLPSFEPEDDDSDQVGEIKHRIYKNVVKISPSGRMSMVNGHRSHSSHRSHYSGGGGHSSHSSHYSSSHTSHYSSSSSSRSSSSNSSSGSSRVSGFYSAPTKTAADYSLGDRTIKSGIYGADVNKLAELLVSKYYLKRNSVTKKSGYTLYDTNMSTAIKHFQRDAGLTPSGTVDNATSIALQTWDENKTTIDLGFRDITEGTAGYDVSQLVKLLTAAGYAPESSKLEYKSGNAVFNSEVAMALKMFQAYNQLEVTGIPDTQTISKLKNSKK
ncbi:MAG: peptidoglycan-binding protein [Prevotella sp.]|nr:peptidoglycan-binding protein [Prevotella sp.]MBR1651912.1 peptidoglycan-binding protein [Alloprevotella sp.]